MSVGALIRDAVKDRLGRQRADARAALERLFASGDAHPSGPIDGEHEKNLMEGEILRDIS